MFEKVIPILKIAALVGAFAAGMYVQELKDDNDLLNKENKTLNELMARKEQVNDLQQKLALEQAKAAASYEEGKESSARDAERTIGDFRTGNIRLRKQLECTNNLLRNLPDAARVGRIAGEEGNCGLSTEDVEFLVQFSAETERLKIKVNSLISAYNSARIKIDQLNNKGKVNE